MPGDEGYFSGESFVGDKCSTDYIEIVGGSDVFFSGDFFSSSCSTEIPFDTSILVMFLAILRCPGSSLSIETELSLFIVFC